MKLPSYSSAKDIFNLENLYVGCLWIVAATLPYTHFNAINSSAILLMGGIWLIDIRWQQKFNRIGQNKIILIFVLFYVGYLLGMFYTSNQEEGINMLQRLIPLLAFPLILGTIPAFPEKKIRILLIIFIASCFLATLICLVYALYQFDNQHESALFFNDRLTTPLDNSAIYFSAYLAFCMFWLTDFFAKNLPKLTTLQKTGLTLLILYFFGIIILLNIRMAIGVLVLTYGIGFIIYFFQKQRFVLGISLGMLPILMFGMSLIFNPRLRQKFGEAVFLQEKIIVGQDKDYSLGRDWGGRAIRMAIWECASDIVKENPVFGVGTGDVQDELQKSYKKNNFLFASDYNGFNSHNQFLETQLALGLPGFLLLSLSFFIPLIRALRAKEYLYATFLIFIMANCLTESFLGRQKGAVFFGMMNALLLFHSKKTISTS